MIMLRGDVQTYTVIEDHIVISHVSKAIVDDHLRRL